MIRINLLPREIYAAEAKQQIKTFSVIVVGAIVALMLAYWGWGLSKVEKMEGELIQAQGELRKFQAIVDKVEELQKTRDKLRARRDVIRRLLVGRLVYPKFFEDFMTLLPSEVWVTSLNTSIAPSGEVRLNISAKSLSNFAIVDWMKNLHSSPLCKDIKLGTITASGQGEGRSSLLSFSISFNYYRKDT